VKRQLAEQAERHGRSMEAEARDILTKGVTRPNIGLALIQAVQEVGGADDLSIPERDDVARVGQVLT
jgi:toxin-antitoxin system